MEQLSSLKQQGPKLPKHQQQMAYFVQGHKRGTAKRVVQVCHRLRAFHGLMLALAACCPSRVLLGQAHLVLLGQDCVLGQQFRSSSRWLLNRLH